MGGPCWIVPPGGGGRVRGPAITDNFQVLPFTFDDRLWQSVEQALQALKMRERSFQERIRLLLPEVGETDSAYGLRMWSEGRRHADIFANWDQIKVNLMYQLCLAKCAAHPGQAQELLATGDAPIEGGPSTSWRHPRLGDQNWSLWNGLCNERVREMLRPEAERDAAKVAALERRFREYEEGYSQQQAE